MLVRRLLPLGLGILALDAAIAGCAPDDEYDLAEASISSALETSRSGATGNVVAGSLRVREDATSENLCVDAARLAADAAARPVTGLYPDGCAVKSVDGDAVHVELHDCTGAFGRAHLAGGIDAHVTGCDESGKVHATLGDSGDLTGNGRPIRWHADAVVTPGDGAYDVAWQASWSATTKRDRLVEHTSSLDIRVDAQSSCLDIAGTTRGHVDAIQFGSTIDGLQVCPDRCPDAGTITVVRDGRRGEKTIVVTFDGTDHAKVHGSKGTFEVPLACDGGG
jgi:hypothetical protein